LGSCRIASLGFRRLVCGKASRFDIRRFEDGGLKAKGLAGSKARGFDMGCFQIASLGFKRLVGGSTSEVSKTVASRPRDLPAVKPVDSAWEAVE
jgi:hypothetical protein